MRFLLPLLLFTSLLFACDASKSSSTEVDSGLTSEVANPAQKPPSGDPSLAELDQRYADYDKAYLAGGCFWCTEAAFDRIEGVVDVWSGYTAGPEKDPTYREVASGSTGHTEAIVIYYDPATVSYETLLDVFFVAHDPTQLNRQGPDVGKQYRSGIYYLNEEQATIARAKIADLEASETFSRPIVTEIEAAGPFYLAEGYHQDYYEDPSNPNQSYVQNVSRPKVEKVMKVFADRLKPEFRQKP